jgi:hypothetical protein
MQFLVYLISKNNQPSQTSILCHTASIELEENPTVNWTYLHI